MNNGDLSSRPHDQAKGMIHRLVYVPILHAREDARQVVPVQVNSSVRTGALPAGTDGDTPSLPIGNSQPSAICEMWAGIAFKIAGLNLPWHRTRIYQDGLPVCGKELNIVTRLARQGSGNHGLILDLLKKGAQLEGTENIDLLMREYDLLNVLLMKPANAALSAPGPTPGSVGKATDKNEALMEYQAQSRVLLAQRDDFISQRLKKTLREGEIPLVFMGVMHRLDKMLEKDFLISCIIYRLPFRSVGAIYNA